MLVAQVLRRLADARGIDDERDLAQGLDRLDQARDPGVVAQGATVLASYACGTPAWIRSCSRTIPSSSCSGRGGQPGT